MENPNYEQQMKYIKDPVPLFVQHVKNLRKNKIEDRLEGPGGLFKKFKEDLQANLKTM